MPRSQSKTIPFIIESQNEKNFQIIIIFVVVVVVVVIIIFFIIFLYIASE